MKAARVFAAALLVAGIVFLVCRYALLPMDSNFSWVQKLGLALAMLGALGVKSLEGEVKTSILATAGLAGAAVALGSVFLFIRPVALADLELVRIELPGIAFDAPDGEPKNSGTSAMGVWQLNEVAGRKGMVQLNWQSGHTELSADDYANVLAAGGIPLGTPQSEPMTVSDHAGQRLTFKVKSSGLVSSVWYCDKHDRDYTLSTAVLESLEAGREFHQRIAQSAQCHVGDKPELVFSLPLIELPAGFGHQEESDPPSFYGLNGSEIAIQATQTEMVEAIVGKPEFVVSMFETSGEFDSITIDGKAITRKARDGRERVLTRILLGENGTLSHSTVTAFGCDEGDSFLLIAVYTSTEHRETIEDAMLSATCANGAPPQEHPTMKRAFANACDAGDSRGCYQLGAIEDTKSPAETNLAKAWYEKGCSVGGGLSCNDLGVILDNAGQKDEALKLFKKACTLGEQLGCDNAGRE